jgi:hypothetical protein
MIEAVTAVGAGCTVRSRRASLRAKKKAHAEAQAQV